jgi:type III pantothenate kinase
MLLTADIGNTNITLGLYENGLLLDCWRLKSEKDRLEDEYGIILSSIINHKGLDKRINHAIIASVVLPLTETFEKAIKKYLGINAMILSHKINTGVKLNVEAPKQVGADRIANAYAAFKLYGTPSVVIDFGTATTFDVIYKDEFIGGVIAPGINISANALSSNTSLLPNIKIATPQTVIGRNTIENMLSGIVIGHAALTEGIISRIEDELNTPVTTIATGGYSQIIKSYIKRPFDYFSPNLTLDGLSLLFELNNI